MRNGCTRPGGVSSAALLLCVLTGVLVGLGGYTFWYAEGASYFSTDPKACMNCHIMRDQYDGWSKASHHAHATCVDCHLPHEGLAKWIAKAENGFWHSAHFTLQDFHEPILIHGKNAGILQANCLNCHEDMTAELARHGAFADGSNQCVRCHRSVGHGPTH